MPLVLYLAIFFFVCACSNSVGFGSHEESQEMSVVEDSLAGMVRVKAGSVESLLGTDDSTAKASERPQMRVALDYEFSFGRHEVTCGEFNKVMKKATGLVLECEDDSLPATNVSYYDAVLYANERSKAEGYDTAYTYTKMLFDFERHSIGLEGLVFCTDRKSYRLPTEAEWNLVASARWDSTRSWTSENSDYELHKVCSRAGKDDDVCDIVGNAMEWVNDWLGGFRDTTVTNYVGTSDGGELGERVLKGGSFRNSWESIRLHSRGDVYTVTSTTRANYVGFRLAFGAIPDGLWLDSKGAGVMGGVVPLASLSTVNSHTGTFKMKLVFRNDVSGNLDYIDYSSGVLTVMEIADSLAVYHPEISPDGQKVAFCTRFEGVSGPSELYVRDLNADGTNLRKLDVESAAVPRWRVLDNGDTVIVYVSDADNNRDSAAFKAASTWQVKFSGGKFGKPEKLFDGAYHGGISEDNTLAVSGARLLRARVAKKGSTVLDDAVDTLWYNGEQACNVSLARDGSKRTLFLDFATQTGRNFVGKNYNVHERLFIADSTGKLIRAVKAPKKYAFDHAEWVTGSSDLIVATLTNSNDAHAKIVLVDLQDTGAVELVDGEELWHPGMWMERTVVSDVDPQLDLDSAGVYLMDNKGSVAAKYRIKMELFWKNLDSTQVLLVGSSRIEMGVNPDLFPEWNMLNFGVPGIDPNRDFYFVRNYALNHTERLKAVVLSIDLDGWRGAEDYQNLIHDKVPGYKYDARHRFWTDGLPKGFLEVLETTYPAPVYLKDNLSARGGLDTECFSWDAEPIDILMDSVYKEWERNYLEIRLAELNALVEKAASRNVYLVGVIFPQAPQYRKTGAFGVYGLQRSVAKKVIASLDSLSRNNKYFVLMDEDKMGLHDYSDGMAWNKDHLCIEGANKLTTRLDSLLKTLE